MRTIARTSAVMAALLAAGGVLAAPPRYTTTDITNWTPTQLATLPFFKHYRPSAIPIANAPTDFHFVSRSASGLIAGNTWNVFVGPDQRGVLLTSTSARIIDSYGDFHWWRTSPPATATYRITNAFDVNWSGVVVGLANLPGTSQTSQQGPDFHAITFDAVHDKTDILPDARYGWATCINNRGEIAGYAYGGPGPIQSGFRRSVTGDFTALNPVPPGYNTQPLWINAQGVVIGMSVPGGWVSPAGSTTSLLTKLFAMPLATVTDLNDAGWVVGTSEQWDHTEQYATLWEPTGGGWIAHDVTDLIDTPGILLDKVAAINNAGQLIVFGHGDGGPPAFGTFLLTPTSTASGSCVPDIGIHPAGVSVCPGVVSMNVVVVNAGGGTTYQWRKDGVAIPASANPSATTAALTFAGAFPADSGAYDCVVTNSCGSTTSNTATLDVHACCVADVDNGTMTGHPDGGVTIDDLLYYLFIFDQGLIAADIDDGSGTGTPDGGVTIDDLLYFLFRFDAGC